MIGSGDDGSTWGKLHSVNSIFAIVSNWGNLIRFDSGQNNGFWQTFGTFGTNPYQDQNDPFVQAGGGNYYLNQNDPTFLGKAASGSGYTISVQETTQAPNTGYINGAVNEPTLGPDVVTGDKNPAISEVFVI